MITISKYSIHVARDAARCALLRSMLAAAGMLAGSTTTGAQQPSAGRLWAAQTGIDQVTLVWDSVPGTAEYRIYLGDPSAPGTLTRPPTRRLRGPRRTILNGVQQAASGITLVAVDAGGRVLKQAEFNRVTPATFFPPATPPTGVTAQATSGSEVVVTWDPVPGATGYVIGRSVHKSGFSMLCSLCPNEGRYVDRNVMAGLPHTYNVAAIFPSGDVSRRVASSPVTPGAAQVGTVPVVMPPSGMPAGGAPIGSMPPGGVPTVGVPPGTMPPTTTTSAAPPPGVPAGTRPTSTSGYTPPGQPAGTMPTPTTSTTAGTTTHAATSPTTSAGTTSPTGTSSGGTMLSNLTGNLARLRAMIDSVNAAHAASGPSSSFIPTTSLQAAMGNVLTLVDSMLTRSGLTDTNSVISSVLARLGDKIGVIAGGFDNSGVVAPPSVTATATGPGAVALSWQPSPTIGITEYVLKRSLNGGAFNEIARLSPTDQSYTDQFFPATLFSSGTVRAKYGVVAIAPTGFRGTATGEIVVQPPAPVSAPAVGGGPLAACRLDFQRADNMWAAFGTPTGSLGAESVSLASGQNKVFITDWKYEKQRNDGSNYYGSHLRIGTNSTSKTIRLHLRSWTLTGLSVLFRTGDDTFWVRLDPNTTTKFQADLMEVFCES